MILAAVAFLAACNAKDMAADGNPKPAASPEVAYADGVHRITPAELQSLIDKGKAFVVDVRGQDAYDMGHIPGATLIPAGEVLDHISELPRDKTIVTYCA
jgi:3-mercaptopyruvate sulfurtransferase SseA